MDTTLYTPHLKVVHVQCQCDTYDEERWWTLEYMKKYGVDNVRGGSFSSVRLSEAEIEIATKQIRGTEDKTSVFSVWWRSFCTGMLPTTVASFFLFVSRSTSCTGSLPTASSFVLVRKSTSCTGSLPTDSSSIADHESTSCNFEIRGSTAKEESRPTTRVRIVKQFRLS
jgi:hypothetical protein